MSFGVWLLLFSLAFSGVARAQAIVEVPSIFLHQKSRLAPLPEYPVVAAESGQAGKVTVEIIVSADGKVASSRILETPSDLIASAVAAALEKWRFDPFVAIGNKPLRARGRLVFYFSNSDGKPAVVDAVGVAAKADAKAHGH